MYKCATFWLIRKSNTWKRIKFKTFLNKLNLETFDAVTLDFASHYVANGPVLAVVEKANYNSADNCVDFECLVPGAGGHDGEVPLLTGRRRLPTIGHLAASQRDRAAGCAGGGGIGADATGNLPVGDTATIPVGERGLRGRPERRFPGAIAIGATGRPRTSASRRSRWWTRRHTSTFRPARART